MARAGLICALLGVDDVCSGLTGRGINTLRMGSYGGLDTRCDICIDAVRMAHHHFTRMKGEKPIQVSREDRRRSFGIGGAGNIRMSSRLFGFLCVHVSGGLAIC